MSFQGTSFRPFSSFRRSGKTYRPIGAAVNYALTGISADENGAALAACGVFVFHDGNQSFIGQTVSDGGGNWTLYPGQSGPFWVREYKAGAPNRAGTSDNGQTPTVV